MTRAFLNRQVFMTVMSVVALTALMVRALIPSGYMLSADSASGRLLEITICQNIGTPPTLSYLDIQTGEIFNSDTPQEEPDHDSDDNIRCAFAMSGDSLAPAILYALATPPHGSQLTLQIPSLQVLGLGLAAPPPPSRGSPKLV